MALFCAVIRKKSGSFVRFPFRIITIINHHESNMKVWVMIIIEVTAITCRKKQNNDTYRLSGPSYHPAGRQKVERA